MTLLVIYIVLAVLSGIAVGLCYSVQFRLNVGSVVVAFSGAVLLSFVIADLFGRTEAYAFASSLAISYCVGHLCCYFERRKPQEVFKPLAPPIFSVYGPDGQPYHRGRDALRAFGVDVRL